MSETEPAAAPGTADGRTEAVEAVAFLARSEHRVRVLELLAERPLTRDELRARTDVSRVTLNRILGDLEERNWIGRRGAAGECSLTDFGELVYEEFMRLVDTVAAGQDRPELVERLPTDWFGFDLRDLSDAETIAADESDPMAPTRVVAEALADADAVRALVGTFVGLPMYAHRETIRNGDPIDGSVVFDADAAAVCFEDSEVERRWREIESETDAPVYHAVEGSFPCNVDLIDGTVFISCGTAAGGLGVLRTENPAVREWAEAKHERVRAAATPLCERSP